MIIDFEKPIGAAAKTTSVLLEDHDTYIECEKCLCRICSRFRLT